MKRIIDTENVNIIGHQIKAAREKAGLTQKQLSEKLELEAVYPVGVLFQELKTVGAL